MSLQNIGSTLLSILVSVIVFGVIIFIHEFGHFMCAKLSGIKVNEFALGMGPKLLKFKKKETQYSLRAFPIGGFCSMEGEDEESDEIGSFSKAPVGNRILVVVAGAIMNLVLGFLVLLVLTLNEPVLASRTVSVFADNAVTEQSGLQVGDTIVSINGRRMFIADDIAYELIRVKDGSADFTVQRDGKLVELKDVKFQTTTTEDGYDSLVFDFKVQGVEKTVGSVLKESFLWTLSLSRQIFLSLVDLVSGNVPVNQLSGPVGIVNIIGQATSIGWSSVFLIVAFISINLGVFNLLPLPALDGGRLVFLIFEAITRKRLNPKYEGIVHIIGFVVLMLLMLFVTYNDITRLFV